jgi:hypothetical protein
MACSPRIVVQTFTDRVGFEKDAANALNSPQILFC